MQAYFPRIVFWILALIIGIVPLVFWHSVFFPHVFTKTILFRVLVEGAMIFWLPLIIFENAWRPRMSLLVYAVGIFFSVLVLTAISGVDFSQSFWSDYERMLGLWTWAHVVLFFLMLVSVVRSEQAWRTLFHVSLGAAVATALYGIGEGLSGSGRVMSTLGNASFFSSYLLLHVFLACALLFQSRPVLSPRGAVYGGAAILFSLALFFTETRASMVGAAAGGIAALLLILVWRWRAHAWFRRGTVGALLAGLVIVGGMIFYRDQLFDALGRPGTAAGRLLAWEVSWEGWKERFILGWGPENYHILFNAHYDMRLHDQEPWFDRAHNFIFDGGGTSGILGLAAYLGMFAAAWAAAYKTLRTQEAQGSYLFFFSLLLLAYLVQNLFMFDVLTSLIVLFLVFGFLAAVPYGEIRVPLPPRRDNAWWACVVVALLLWAPFYYGNAKVFLENMAAHAGWEALRQGEPDGRAIAHFEKALSYKTHGDVDARRFFAEYVFEFLKQGGQRPEESLRLLMSRATEMMEANIQEEPENVKWVMYQGELYNLMAPRFDPAFAGEAKKYFSRARELSPGRAQIYLELAQAHKMLGDVSGMWEALDFVEERVPDWPGIHANSVALAIEVGDKEREEEEIRWAISHETGEEYIRDAYARTGRYTEAVRFQKLRIERSKNGELAPLYAELAALYHLAGDKGQARAAALKVLELDPARKSEVEAFLLELET